MVIYRYLKSLFEEWTPVVPRLLRTVDNDRRPTLLDRLLLETITLSNKASNVADTIPTNNKDKCLTTTHHHNTIPVSIAMCKCIPNALLCHQSKHTNNKASSKEEAIISTAITNRKHNITIIINSSLSHTRSTYSIHSTCSINLDNGPIRLDLDLDPDQGHPVTSTSR